MRCEFYVNRQAGRAPAGGKNRLERKVGTKSESYGPDKEPKRRKQSLQEGINAGHCKETVGVCLRTGGWEGGEGGGGSGGVGQGHGREQRIHKCNLDSPSPFLGNSGTTCSYKHSPGSQVTHNSC